MTDDVIVKNEVLNDGGTVHLYYNHAYKEYVAYGFSAFIAGVIVPTIMKNATTNFSYSKDLQMPFLIVGKNDLQQLQTRMEIKETGNRYICLQGVAVLDEHKYEKWASTLRGE